MTEKVLFISGIGTNVGKSYATGWLARHLIAQGQSVITQKMIQTGNQGASEDIDVHRRIMGMQPNELDLTMVTAPQVFSYPASPHLAAQLDNRPVDLQKIDNATAQLARLYDTVLVEGAGGLMVPLTEDYLTIDFIAHRHYPVVLVTNGMLGSINHTLLSIEALQKREIALPTVIYNSYFDDDQVIAADNQRYVRQYLAKHSPSTTFMVMPRLDI